MFESIEFALFKIAILTGSALYSFTDSWGWLLSLLAGIGLPTIYFDKPKTEREETITRRAIIALSILFVLFGTLSNITIPWVLIWIQSAQLDHVITVNYSWRAYLLWPSLFIGITLHIVVRRQLSPLKNKIKTDLTKKSALVREERTDVRNIRQFLPETMEYDPLDHIDLSKGMFVGLDRHQQPQYIPMADWQKQHADILGTTGAGKGVASGMLLYQSIMADEGVFVLDPKNDEWAPHLFRYACEQAGKPFYLIDLNRKEYQLDLFADINEDQIEELLVAGLSLAEKGDIADFYRIDDRKAARETPRLANDEEMRSIEGLFNSEYVQSISDNIKAFYGKMEELALVQSINAIGGLNLKDIFDHGGCCYIIGSLRNSKIIIAQRMILIRLFQLAEERDRVKSKPRPIAIFLDELKYHLSKAALEGLGAARDKGVHIIMAHQSVADLKDCPADLNGEAVVGAVVENTKFKLVYKLQDPETAEWVSKMSGTILVDDETRQIESSRVLTENVSTDRSVRLAERYFVDTNMLQSLPNGVSYIFTPSEPPRPSLISPIKVKKETLKYHSVNEQQSVDIKTPLDTNEDEDFEINTTPNTSFIDNPPLNSAPKDDLFSEENEADFDFGSPTDKEELPQLSEEELERQANELFEQMTMKE
ncbi:type IV secretory system conjugative DNA transfer family protein [Aliivibrio sifiae]|uniref:MFS transporter n=1 Tax=Aliivibrio sifiae TaxID=566293 RepID=A0A2S7X145_9GAMM|nr:TraM recognition domain-containing protein [Aliivibrio sifiae]PQJ83559.1 MFS transporter [Aliivibrio sifiae]GLR76806.1 molybdopterin-guanine dinucleotide biosynthesis protein MobB [Aliivibrio sifiae]